MSSEKSIQLGQESDGTGFLERVIVPPPTLHIGPHAHMHIQD